MLTLGKLDMGHASWTGGIGSAALFVCPGFGGDAVNIQLRALPYLQKTQGQIHLAQSLQDATLEKTKAAGFVPSVK